MKGKIFVCEDDQGILEVIKTVLESEGYELTCFTSGKGIVERIKAERPALLLLDLWMPEVDGETLIKTLKQDIETAGLPVVLVSAASEIERIAAEQKADDILKKPFHIDELLSMVEKHVSSS
jgi:DNA-binding response OmpR family regulator